MKYPIIRIGKSHDPELDGNSFVGVSRFDSSGGVSIVVPYGLQSDELADEVSDSDTFQKDQYAFLRRYVKVVQKALASNYTKERLEDKAGIHNPVAAVNLLHDYLSLGKFIEFDTVSDLSERGKIDFSQTIKKVSPTIAGNSIYFDKYITRRRSSIEDNLVSEVQCNIINHFMDHGGVVLFGQSISIPIHKLDFTKKHTIDATINRLRKELTNTFNSRKESIIRWSISYMEGLRNLNEKEKEGGSWAYAIIASTLWEAMINSVFGNHPEWDKTKYGKRYKFTYMDGRYSEPKNATQHDTIYEDDETLIIIDAKMYGSPDGLLSEKVLGKQFGYYEQAKIVKKEANEHKNIINILVLPYTPNAYGQGFQNRVILDPHTPKEHDPQKIIYLYGYSTKELIDDYYYGRKKYHVLIDDFKRFIQKNPAKFFLEERGCSYSFKEMPEVNDDVWVPSLF